MCPDAVANRDSRRYTRHVTTSDRFAQWYEYECDCNKQMLAFFETVPQENRGDDRYQRAVDLAGHLAACRENWLDRMINSARCQVEWWQSDVPLASLHERYETLQAHWKSYLAALDDAELARDFDFFGRDGSRYRWNVEGQLVQLNGHAWYHRGQIALLIDSLGGETVDTDYLYWAYEREPRYRKFDEAT